ncbi:MAG: mechanosensitive ion channel domain-containing protein [Halolamina sp.]
MLPLQAAIVERALDQFVVDITSAIPQVLSGLVFLVLAGVLGKLVMIVVRTLLDRVFPAETDVYQRFIAAVVAAFLWFGIALSFLSIVGLDDIAASLGTAAGFLALGVSYSLSSMIADAVAGVYLIRDPDFVPGDRVEVGDISGTITSIELRKTRFRDENDDVVVRGNAEIEKKWTKLDDAVETEGSPADGVDESADELSDDATGDATEN